MLKTVQTLCLSFLFLLTISCGNEKKDPGRKTDENLHAFNPDFVQDTFYIDDQSIPYPNDSVALIMEKAGMCIVDTLKANEKEFAPCHPNFFRFFKNSNSPLRDGFLVEVRPFVFTRAYQVVNIVRNEEGEYKISNNLGGQLLEMRTTPEGRYDLVIRYADKRIGTVAILHKWKKYQYEPVEVIEINNHFVIPEKKDSLNKVYLTDFPWGF